MNKQEIAIEYFYKQMERGLIENDAQQEVFETAISALEQQLTNRWVPVSERLPEDEKYYNVTILQRKNPVEYCFYNKSKRKFYIVADGDEELDQVWEEEAKNVIAWQPLPEPCEEEEE